MLQFGNILVGVDFSPLSEVAVRAATSFCDRFQARNLHLVHVIELLPQDFSPTTFAGDSLALSWELAQRDAGKRLAELAVSPTAAKVTRATRIGPPAREIAEEAADRRADLIIAASHDRRGMERIVLGSVTSTLLRVAPVPVLVVGKDRPGVAAPRRIMAAVDLSPVSDRVLGAAAEVAAAASGELTVVSMCDLPVFLPPHHKPEPLATPAELDTLEARYRAEVDALVEKHKRPGLSIRVEVLRKAPAHNAILDLASMLTPDLVVIGTSGRNAWQRFFLGSTATRVTSAAPCPVLCVPAVSPAA